MRAIRFRDIAQGLRIALATCLLTLLTPLAGHAFEDYEHAAMSDRALRLAGQYTHVLKARDSPSVKDLDLVQLDKALLALQTTVKVGRVTSSHYGQLSACVDFFLMPEKMLAFQWGDSAERNVMLGSIPTLGQFGIGRLEERCVSGLQFLQATHNNHAHFQQDLMMSWRIWHAQAVAANQQDKNLYGGLVINAIADHYLQDFFAPGHIVTPREIMTDVTSTAMHDLANKMGVMFKPKPATGRLREILLFLCPNALNAPPVKACGGNADVNAVLNEAELTDAAADVANLLSDDPRAIRFRGDKRLNDDPQAPQRMLLLAVQVQSVMDVIERKNAFETFRFELETSEWTPSAIVDFGQYDIGDRALQVNPVDSGVATTEADAPLFHFSKLTSCALLGQCNGRLYQLRSSVPVFSFSLSTEAQSNGAYAGRNVVTTEASWGSLFLDWSKLSGRFVHGVQLTPIVGYSAYRQGVYSGKGFAFRLALALPETEMAIGPYARWLSYEDDAGKVRKMGYGAQFEAGFSSYFTFFLIAGRDHSTSTEGRLEKGLLLGGGLRASLPLTRFSLKP